MQRFLCPLLISLATLSTPALAQSWPEAGDAPALPPGQATNGAGPLAQITGSLATTNDVDLFAIRIDNPAAFFASTQGGATYDTQLFLFDTTGHGITHNDDAGTGIPQSRLSGQFVPGPGTYLLAISRYDRDPVNAANQQIWNDAPFETERPPDGPGAPGPVTNWIGSTAAPGTYTIFMGGASYSVQPSTGACCFGTSCQVTSSAACTAGGGLFQGVGSSCTPNPCYIPPPPNDTCANAQAVADGTTSFSTLGATNDGPSACVPIGGDIWFRYHSQCAGPVTVHTCGGTSLDTVLMVEQFIREHSGEYTKTALWQKLPKRTMYQTFSLIIEYLGESAKVSIDREGKVGWIYNPKLAKKFLNKGVSK